MVVHDNDLEKALGIFTAIYEDLEVLQARHPTSQDIVDDLSEALHELVRMFRNSRSNANDN